jgi:hypothetical protein
MGFQRLIDMMKSAFGRIMQIFDAKNTFHFRDAVFGQSYRAQLLINGEVGLFLSARGITRSIA